MKPNSCWQCLWVTINGVSGDNFFQNVTFRWRHATQQRAKRIGGSWQWQTQKATHHLEDKLRGQKFGARTEVMNLKQWWVEGIFGSGVARFVGNFCNNTGMNPECWKSSNKARMFQCMELHNKAVEHQDVEQQNMVCTGVLNKQRTFTFFMASLLCDCFV